MKNLLNAFALAAVLAATPFVSQAQHTHGAGGQPGQLAPGEMHAHVAPHGGVVRSAGAYHLELLMQATSLDVYLLGAKMSAVPNRGTTGSVLVQLANNTTATLPLVPAGADHFSAKLPTGAKVRTAIVTLNASGKTVNARFDKLDGAAGKAVGAVYTCPMHPEVTSRQPGKCPKCGMALVKKS
ncbi:hypothetical protein A0257_21120 [Hymenobacter psoromatis]|nr:hypothetical protein A0257_21120 [Hymenobacter psoromatis]